MGQMLTRDDIAERRHRSLAVEVGLRHGEQDCDDVRVLVGIAQPGKNFAALYELRPADVRQNGYVRHSLCARGVRAGFSYPLATAVVRNQKQIVGLLLQQGADVNAKIEGFLCYTVLTGRIHPWPGVLWHTPLTVAAALGHIDIAAELTASVHGRARASPWPSLSGGSTPTWRSEYCDRAA